MQNKKSPLTVIQEAIKEDEVERLPKKVFNYTVIIGICAAINLVCMYLSLPKEANTPKVSTDVPSELSEGIENIEYKITALQEKLSGLREKRIVLEDLQNSFDKKASGSIELIITRLSEIDKEVSLVESDVMEIWKKVVSIEKKQIEIKNQVRENQ